MTCLRLTACALLFGFFPGAGSGSRFRPDPQPLSGKETAAEIDRLKVDADHVWRVRDLQIVRGDIKLYLSEGVLGFFSPVGGRVLAAVYTTDQVEAGDAEVILLPPTRSERASLAGYTGSANLNEHFSSAVFFFSDATASEIEEQIRRGAGRAAPDLAPILAKNGEAVVQSLAAQFHVKLAGGLLDRHAPQNGFFFSLVMGRRLGAFDLRYDPADFEPASAGRPARLGQSPGANSHSLAAGTSYDLWTSFRPKRAPEFVQPPIRINDYRIDATVQPDLTLHVKAAFELKPDPADGRAVPLRLSSRLQVASASIDGSPAEVLQGAPAAPAEFGSAETLLLIAGQPLEPDKIHRVEMSYAGAVIRQTSAGDYFVDERNTWYPISGRVLSNFDLTFHCPEALGLVSTGELVSENTSAGVRTVHRRTSVPAALAGFNLGHYRIEHGRGGPYQVDVYSSEGGNAPQEDIRGETARILENYSARWGALPFHSLAISPIPGYFGQGFPGLIYLATMAYLPRQDRPAALRNPRSDLFFSDLLLPHEIAHQWWGNIVRQAEYRAGWLTEALANDAALTYIADIKGGKVRDEILETYRDDLLRKLDGKVIESSGPVDFGERLIDTDGLYTWHVITYEKGSWLLHMLRERLGAAGFSDLQRQLLRDFAEKPLTNEDFRREASRFVPAGQPDRTLSGFFDTWVYNTGIPHLRLRREGRAVEVEVSGVDDDFLADVPLRCKDRAGKPATEWLRAASGSNPLEGPGAQSCELPAPNTFLYIPESR